MTEGLKNGNAAGGGAGFRNVGRDGCRPRRMTAATGLGGAGSARQEAAGARSAAPAPCHRARRGWRGRRGGSHAGRPRSGASACADVRRQDRTGLGSEAPGGRAGREREAACRSARGCRRILLGGLRIRRSRGSLPDAEPREMRGGEARTGSQRPVRRFEPSECDVPWPVFLGVTADPCARVNPVGIGRPSRFVEKLTQDGVNTSMQTWPVGRASVARLSRISVADPYLETDGVALPREPGRA